MDMVTTELAVEAVAWGRAPRHDGDRVNRRIVCADGFAVSVQASSWHYCEDSHPTSPGPYWRDLGSERQVVADLLDAHGGAVGWEAAR